MISKIAIYSHKGMWNHERHTRQLEENGESSVSIATYKTPDFMLSSAQDHNPGELDGKHHIWQLVLDCNAMTFVNHPMLTIDEATNGGFWSGNGVLPRVVQWKDTLIALYKLPQNDWFGFTHAYFPVYAWDDYVTHGQWAFARKGDGYLALTAEHGFTLIDRNDYAFRELRSYGKENIWLCFAGCAASDHSFDEFVAKVVALDITFDGLSIQCQTPRAETLSFGWDTAMLVNGNEHSIEISKHYQNPFCVKDIGDIDMLITFGEKGLKLNFGDDISSNSTNEKRS